MKKRRPREGTKTQSVHKPFPWSYADEKKKTPRGDENLNPEIDAFHAMPDEKKKTSTGDCVGVE